MACGVIPPNYVPTEYALNHANALCLPGVGGQFSLSITNTSAAIYAVKDDKLLATIELNEFTRGVNAGQAPAGRQLRPLSPGRSTPWSDPTVEGATTTSPQDAASVNTGAGTLPPDQCIFLVPGANLLAMLPPTQDHLILRHINFPALLEKAGVEYCYPATAPPCRVFRGKTYNYHPDIKTSAGGVICTLVKGPPGMVVTIAGDIIWNVPANYQGTLRDSEQISLAFKDAAGNSCAQQYELMLGW